MHQRERDIQKENQTDRDRQTDRQTERQTERPADIEIDRQTDRAIKASMHTNKIDAFVISGSFQKSFKLIVYGCLHIVDSTSYDMQASINLFHLCISRAKIVFSGIYSVNHMFKVNIIYIESIVWVSRIDSIYQVIPFFFCEGLHEHKQISNKGAQFVPIGIPTFCL